MTSVQGRKFDHKSFTINTGDLVSSRTFPSVFEKVNFAETKIVDKRNQSKVGEYGVSFATRKLSGALDLGHAFIIWYYSDPGGNRTTKRASGFYPVDADYRLVAGVAPGDVLDDSETDIAKQLVVLVSKPAFESAVEVESEYSNGTWSLGFNDCVTFVENVARKLPGLQLPSRVVNIYPSSYIAALWDEN